MYKDFNGSLGKRTQRLSHPRSSQLAVRLQDAQSEYTGIQLLTQMQASVTPQDLEKAVFCLKQFQEPRFVCFFPLLSQSFSLYLLFRVDTVIIKSLTNCGSSGDAICLPTHGGNAVYRLYRNPPNEAIQHLTWQGSTGTHTFRFSGVTETSKAP